MCGGIEKSLNALGENFGLGVGFGIGANGMPFFGIKSEVVVSVIPKIKTVFEMAAVVAVCPDGDMIFPDIGGGIPGFF